MSVNTKMTAIADAIREKTGIPSLMTLDDMSKSIEEVYQGGVSYTDEKISEINAELEKTLFGTEYGGKSWYDAFWDIVTANNTRPSTDSIYMFRGWNFQGGVFNPPYPLVFKGWSTEGIFLSVRNLKEIPTGTIDCSGMNVTHFMFNDAHVKKIGVLDFSSSSNIDACFRYCTVEEIEKIILPSNNTLIFTGYNGTFYQCNKLREIRFEGGHIGSNISFQWSTLLSAESIVSIVERLSGTVTGQTLTLSQTAVDNADWTTTDYASWDSLIATKPNWTFSLV